MDEVLGHQKIKKQLSYALKEGKLGQLLLFSGEEGIGKSVLARALAKEVLCETEEARYKFTQGVHPDFHLYSPEGKLSMHSMDSMKAFCKEVFFFPHEAKKKVFIIEDAERMLETSSNALLKTLEEPAENSLIILLSSRPDSLLPTIVSRCRVLHFSPLSTEEVQQVLEKLSVEGDLVKASKLSRGSVAKALEYLSSEEEIELLGKILSGSMRGNYPLFQETVQGLFARLEQDKRAILKQNVDKMEGRELNAFQKERLKKEGEALASLQVLQKIEHWLEYTSFWFRDLHLLKENLSIDLLFHAEKKDLLEQYLSFLPLPSSGYVERSLQDVKQGLARALKPEVCFEALCLKLGVI